jgi:hypothetical protein
MLRPMGKVMIKMAISGSTLVELLTSDLEIEGLNPVTTARHKEEIVIKLANGGSTLVEQLTTDHEIKCSNPAS